MTHCDVFLLAGQKKATSGNAGLWVVPCFLSGLAFFSGFESSLLDVRGEESPFFFFLALYGEDGAGIITAPVKRVKIDPIKRTTNTVDVEVNN